MNNRFLVFALLSMSTVSCSLSESVQPDVINSSDKVFYASIEESQPSYPDTKVYADEDLKILWNADDRITIFNKNTYNQQYRFSGKDGDNAGGFKKVVGDDEFFTGNDLDKVYAVYPYQESNSISNKGVFSYDFPYVQSFLPASFGRGANVMVSATTDNQLRFKNVGGYLSFKFYGKDVEVSSIVLRGNNGENLAGTGTVDMSSGLPELSFDASSATKKLTLDCSSPVSLGASASELTEFWFVVPPMTMSNGFTVKVMTSDGCVFEKTSNNKLVIGRNSITRMKPIEVVPVPLGSRFFELSGIGKVPYISRDFSLSANMQTFTEFLSGSLEIDYDRFVRDYTLTGVYGYENVLGDDGQVVNELTKIASIGTGYQTTLYFYDRKYNKTVNYGTVCYKSGSGISEPFTWTVKPMEMGANQSKTLYFRFEKGVNDIVYIAFTAEVASAARFDFGSNRIANEWYDDINGEVKNTARFNVRVPNSNSDDITDFSRTLDKFFMWYKPSIVLSADSDPVYKNYFSGTVSAPYMASDLATKYNYCFASEQPSIAGYNLCTNYWEDSRILYVASYQNTVTVNYNGRTIRVPAYDDSSIIATIDSDWNVKYHYAAGDNLAKKLLNLWSYSETDQSRMLYANVLANMFYGDSDIPAGTASLHIRFLRPVDIYLNAQSASLGEDIYVQRFINGIVDWNKQSLVRYDTNTGNLMENIIAGVNMFAYYGFRTLTINLDSPVASYGANVQLRYRFADGSYANVASSGQYTFNLSSISNLNNYVLTCSDTGSASGYIQIPVEFTYAWGTITSSFAVRII